MQFPMAVHQFFSVDVSTSFGRIGVGLSRSRGRGGHTSTISPVQCVAVDHAKTSSNGKSTVYTTSINDTIARRSANYEPPVWGFDYIQSITSDYADEGYRRRVNKLKEEVKVMLTEKVAGGDSLAQLELIDTLQRLGVSYHFDNEIDTILRQKYANTTNDPACDNTCATKNTNLYATALEFRLLRQQGYLVPQEVFNVFKDETGNFKACMSDDMMGILSLYEASFHLMKGESTLEEAKEFTTKCLEKFMMSRQNKLLDDDDLGLLVSHALELPLHWRMLRLEARWFIDVYEKRQDKNSTLLEFAKLDFNMVQLTHQKDLKHVSRWWKHTKLGQKLNFARDRMMENFLWTVGFIFEPQFTYGRRMTTKVVTLITVIDDIYDVYGTLEELELFTDAVERWDLNAIDHLPDYMKICFLVLHNSINEMVFDVLKELEFLNIKYLKKSWVDLCRCYLLEAKWYHSGYTPTLQEYIENAWISSSVPVALMHCYFLLTNPITEEALECLETYSSIIRRSSMLLRLEDDLGTSSDEMKRGDVPKSIQCYMHETGVSEDEARQHIKYLISETWKQLNEDRVAESCFSHKFVEVATNIARMALCLYQHGSGHSSQDCHSKERISALLINPIPLSNP